MTDFIINDSTSNDILFPAGVERGLDLTGRPEADYGYGSSAEPFPSELLIPRSEWQARIKEREERKLTNRDSITQAGLPAKNQGRTLYCWINGPVHCLEIVRVRQNLPMTILSPASAGAQIKGFRNVGGWGKEGLQWIAEHGVCPVSAWPANAIDRRYLTQANKELAAKYRTTEWWELRRRDLDQLVSCLLHGLVVTGGYNWWEHQITIVDPVWKDGEVATLIRNQWANWGDDNYATLQGSRMYPDDQVTPRVATAV